MRALIRATGFVLAFVMAVTVGGTRLAMAADASLIERDADAALTALFEKTPAAKDLATRARGILVFPNIVKAGFLGGAQYGEGTLRKSGKTAGFYNIAAVSYGFQAGVQTFGYAMFFMSDSALNYLDKTDGWEVGMGPSVVIFDAGMARSATTTTMKDDVYAFIFDQKGLMAGTGLQGSKITRINR